MMTAAVGLVGECTMGLAYCRLPVLMAAARGGEMGVCLRCARCCRVRVPMVGVTSAELHTSECRVLRRVGFRWLKEGLIMCMPTHPRDGNTNCNVRAIQFEQIERTNQLLIKQHGLLLAITLTEQHGLCPNHRIFTRHAMMQRSRS